MVIRSVLDAAQMTGITRLDHARRPESRRLVFVASEFELNFAMDQIAGPFDNSIFQHGFRGFGVYEFWNAPRSEPLASDAFHSLQYSPATLCYPSPGYAFAPIEAPLIHKITQTRNAVNQP